MEAGKSETESESVNYQNIEQVTDQTTTICNLYITLLTAINASWLGVLAAAAFISTLYYPPIWFMVVLSAAVQQFLTKLYSVAVPFTQTALRETLNELARLERVH